MTWESRISFGKHTGMTLLNLLIIHKPYLRWCYENELHLKYDELLWLFENINSHEEKEIGL